MIVNGKEVFYSTSDAEEIQAKLNQNDYIDPLVKGLEQKEKDREDKEKRTGYGNFEVSRSGIPGIVSNVDRFEGYDKFSQMEKTVFIKRGLEIVADDATQPNMEGNVLKILSNDSKIKERLENLFIERLDMDNELWSCIYETCKKGDNFYEIIPDDYKKPRKIIMIRYLDPKNVERVEENNNLKYFLYHNEDYTGQKKEKKRKKEDQELETYGEGTYKLQPWQVVHFKIEDKENTPYGGSLLKAAVKPYDYLSLLEDVMLIYRISRSPERRVFYIDVGNLSPTEAKQFLQQLKTHYRSESILDENGKLNKRANVLSITSDIFVPMRNGTQGTKIDTLQAGEALATTDDVKYFRDQILKTMNIPPDYLGDAADRSRGSLSQLDIKEGRFIQRIQAQITLGLYKIACLDLYFGGFKKEELKGFHIQLTPPSNIKELTELDIINQRMNLIQTILSLNIFPLRWVFKNILKFSDKEISDIMLYKKLETSIGDSPMNGAEGGGGGAGPGMVGGDMSGGIASPVPEAGVMPPEEGKPEVPNTGEVPPSQPGAPAPASTPAPNTIPQETIAPEEAVIHILGKEFIVEHAEDFFKIVKYMKEDHVQDKIPLFESISKVMRGDIVPKKKIKNSPNSFDKLKVINEFGGILMDDENPKIRLYEKKNKGNGSFIFESVIYSMKDGNKDKTQLNG